MTFEGNTEIKAERSKVWDFITDPQALSSCMKGLSDIEVQDSAHFTAKMDLGLSFVTGSFQIGVEFFDIKKPHELKARIEAKGMGSSATATSHLTLSGEDVTTMSWKMEVERRGLLAPVPDSLILGVSKNIQDDVIKKIKEHLET